MEEAFLLLRRYARAHHQPLNQVAREVMSEHSTLAPSERRAAP